MVASLYARPGSSYHRPGQDAGERGDRCYGSAMATVLGIRHALVENPDGLVYGRLPGFRLTSEGRAAAEDLARLLSGAEVVAVVSSPLDRAVETARILAAPHGLEVLSEDRLLEWVGMTRWEGQAWAGLVRSEEYRALMADPSAAPSLERPIVEAGRAVSAWAREAAERWPDGMVLGISHEASLAAAYLVGRDGSFRQFRATHIPHLSAVRLEPGPPALVDPAQALHAG
jgi:broad specificity phosphatase PhoE